MILPQKNNKFFCVRFNGLSFNQDYSAAMDIMALSAQNNFSLSMVKQSAASSEALVNLIETSAQLAKAILDLGVGGAVDIIA